VGIVLRGHAVQYARVALLCFFLVCFFLV
jgi:hypothetical protein